MNEDVKMAFVREVLSRKGQQLQNAIIRSITREGLSNPSEGITGRLVELPDGAAWQMTIPILRRWQDMGAPLERNHSSFLGENVKTTNLNMLKGKKYRVYNRNVWGFYLSIARELMYGLTDDVVTRIKKQLEG
jgi:hypothetical protein